MRNVLPTIRGLYRPAVWLLWLSLPALAIAQTSFMLQITSLQVTPGQPVEFNFTDSGTGSTNYQVEFTEVVNASATWETLPDAVISNQGGDSYHVLLENPNLPSGYFRVRGLGGSVPVVSASFSTTALEVIEGAVVAPVIHFSGPYHGIIRYTIGGTASSGDYQSLSGEVLVHGTSATIPISFEDNQMIGQLKHLTLTLQAGPGIQLGSGSELIVTIAENDAEWQGSLLTGEMLLGFVLTLQQSNGVAMASLKGTSAGLFPTTDFPVDLVWTENQFTATALNIPVSPDSTLLGLPMYLTLLLDAVQETPGQSVSPTQIEGAGMLINHVPDRPHLSSTNSGTFILLRPPAAPSTNQVDLVNLN